jgi:Arc/MetJ-type ribon-helix-helix transcriptional regulator
MLLSLSPEIQRYIDEQVKVGRFPTPEALVEAAITGLQETNNQELDEKTVAVINEAEEQADRGEGTDLSVFRAQINKRFVGI